MYFLTFISRLFQYTIVIYIIKILFNNNFIFPQKPQFILHMQKGTRKSPFLHVA
ncbi:hypothetical protein HMPREF9429_00806 [Megasphaera micronuciformis F0359]|uniref:Uncharacterized protein n=1 Tax=Megasphaera micronuciformis F0359 TaxID=706434 RepID=E2ZBH9_9FIRM|nr:hypothetical protein HMPREF9429_00806 [Megasphaera micronuciformis F0359]